MKIFGFACLLLLSLGACRKSAGDFHSHDTVTPTVAIPAVLSIAIDPPPGFDSVFDPVSRTYTWALDLRDSVICTYTGNVGYYDSSGYFVIKADSSGSIFYLTTPETDPPVALYGDFEPCRVLPFRGIAPVNDTLSITGNENGSLYGYFWGTYTTAEGRALTIYGSFDHVLPSMR